MNDKLKKSAFSHLFRLIHWGLGASMFIMIYTGLALHSIARPEWSLIGRFPTWMFGGRLVLWHKITAIFFAASIVLGSIKFFTRGHKKKIWNWRWLANYLLIIGGIGSVVTSIGLIYSNIPEWLYLMSRMVHSVSGLVILPLSLILHIILAFTKYLPLLIQAFAPFRQAKWKQAVIWIPVALLVSYLILTRAFSGSFSSNQLKAIPIKNVAAGIEKVKSLEWDKAEDFNFNLVNGNGFNKGITRVKIKAMYDQKDIYFMIKWKDPLENSWYWPWEKTKDGWKHLVSNKKDENVYYEDKFAMIFPIGNDTAFNQFGCSIHCHNTPKRPFGYKGASRKIDVWHWKASRTAPVGYVDDKYFLGHDESLKDGGRIADPKTKGGYKYNLSKDEKYPSHLPGREGSVLRGALIKSKAVAFTKALGDTYHVGHQIPGIVIEPVVGDRGDIKCESEYNECFNKGFWTIYMRRALDTKSEHDVQFTPGKKYKFACAAFDHTGKRHAYNQQTYTLILKK